MGVNQTNDQIIVLSVIVPTRNEAENIRPLLVALAEAVGETATEVIFVDDSSDDTPAVVRVAMTDFPFQIRLLVRPLEERNGLSGAVVDGLRMAHGRWVCVMDADLQHPPSLLPQLLRRATETGADMVVGSRLAGRGGPIGLSRLRSMTSQLLTLLARGLFPRLLANVSDPLTGLFLVRREAVDPALLRPDGFKILLEILVRCPDLRVSEVHFEFGARYAGQSKADFHEGIRFFRHLLRLRVTANQHFVRFPLVGILGLVINGLLVLALTEWAGFHYLLAAALATQGSAVWNFILTEHWVFGDRRQGRPAGQRLARFLLMNNGLLLLHLPLMSFLVERLAWPYLLANLFAILVTTLVRYILSDRWIWTTGWIGRRPHLYYYNIHGLVRLETMVRLPELDDFSVADPLEQVDVRLLVDRHGTPRCLPGGLCYDEGLGRFGFGVTILTGSYAEVVVSPLLRHAPHLVYDQIVKPLLCQGLVRQGYTFVPAACLAHDGRATLLVSGNNDETAVFLLAAAQQGQSILASETTLLGEDGQVLAYPTLLQGTPVILSHKDFGFGERLSIVWRYWLGRVGTGLWPVFGRLGLPVMSLAAMAELFVPRRCYPVHEWYDADERPKPAILAEIISVSTGQKTQVAPMEAAGLLRQQSGRATGFALSRQLFPVEESQRVIEKALQVERVRPVATGEVKQPHHFPLPSSL